MSTATHHSPDARTDVWIWLNEEKERLEAFKDWAVNDNPSVAYKAFTADDWFDQYRQFRAGRRKVS